MRKYIVKPVHYWGVFNKETGEQVVGGFAGDFATKEEATAFCKERNDESKPEKPCKHTWLTNDVCDECGAKAESKPEKPLFKPTGRYVYPYGWESVRVESKPKKKED